MPSMPPGPNGAYATKGLPREVFATLLRACAHATEFKSLQTAGQRWSVPILHPATAVFAIGNIHNRPLADIQHDALIASKQAMAFLSVIAALRRISRIAGFHGYGTANITSR